MANGRGGFQTWIPAIVGGAALIAAIIVAICLSMMWNQEETDLRMRIDSVASEATAIEDAKQSALDESAYLSAGLSFERVNSDKVELNELFSEIVTWSNFDEYTAIRDKLINEYKVSPDSWLLSTFMPVQEVYHNAESNRDWNMIDERGWNMSFVTADVRCIGANGDTYSYFAQVTAESAVKDQVGQSDIVFMADVAKDGSITKLEALPVSGTTG